MVKKCNETKIFERSNEIYKLVDRLLKKRNRKKFSNVCNDRAGIITESTDIKEIIGDIMGNFMPINLITSMKWMIYTNTINSREKTDNLKKKAYIYKEIELVV